MLCRAELESRKESYDVIIGDLADPIEGGPCYKLYTKSFYEFVVKLRLNPEGIFVTQVHKIKLCMRARVCSRRAIMIFFGSLNIVPLREYVRKNLTQFMFALIVQAGPAGIFSHTEVFSCIYNTLRQVFKCGYNLTLL